MARVGVIVLAVLLAACSTGTNVRTAGTTAPTTAAPTTTTSTSTTLPPSSLHKIVIFGDSIMFVTSKFQVQRFQAAGIEAVNQSFPGTSILGHTDVSQTFARVMQEEHPDVVLAEYSGVYLPPYPKTSDGRDIALASPEYWAAWKEAALRATRDLASTGARVYWVLLPHDKRTWASGDTRMNDLYTALSKELPNVGLVDWRWAVSGPYGAPVDQLPIGPNGAMANVRGSDGYHFSLEASDVLAGVTVTSVLRDYGR